MKHLAIAFAAGFGAFTALLLTVFMSGATFGQRCDRAYSAPAEREACVERLSKGGKVYAVLVEDAPKSSPLSPKGIQ